ncbi:CACNA1G [Symbiodinium sp. CCMP2592]|nr:CACNA1G [Symbiodinium sp. CCMP2592]
MQGSSPLQEVAPMLFFALLGCLFAYKHYQANDESKLRSERYTARAPAFSSKKKAEEAAPPDSRATEPTAIRPAEEDLRGSQNLLSPAELSDDADKMVWAYYNPFSAVWHRLPDGFEPPASMDLTAWHKKHIESKEWNRLFAEGKLAEIIPRGGLKVRYVPMWDTHEPVLVKERC